MRLLNKVALVTGAGQGIGKAIANTLNREGAFVVAVDLSTDAINKNIEEMEQPGKTMAVAADVSDSRSVVKAFASLKERFGHVDILVNNAGIGQAPGDGFDLYQQRLAERTGQLLKGETPTTYADHLIDMSDAGWHAVIAVNLNGTFYCCREALRLMVETETKGSIISVSSTGAYTGEGAPHYCASKAGVQGLTRALADEVGARGIRVNAVVPGPTMTPAMMTISEDWRQSMAQSSPLQRMANPSEIANTVLFLASDESSNFTGQSLCANGGSYML
jgi:3-oxoacyl-[acyl-carrier protein] reductase